MSDPGKKQGDQNPYVLVATVASGFSFGIAALGMMGGALTQWPVALMVAAPSLMGIGIAYFMAKQPPKAG